MPIHRYEALADNRKVFWPLRPGDSTYIITNLWTADEPHVFVSDLALRQVSDNAFVPSLIRSYVGRNHILLGYKNMILVVSTRSTLDDTWKM